ncbi:hypothetical protein, partial [Methylobacterium sp. Leaf85]|uniref:hypothetical protein n=1 Tax=Methylobacterium sp. Leaf85 TaxID=1736241 RepID=UPI000A9E4980
PDTYQDHNSPEAMYAPDTYQDHNSPEAMYAEAGLDADGIVRTVQAALPEQKARSGAKLVSIGNGQR